MKFTTILLAFFLFLAAPALAGEITAAGGPGFWTHHEGNQHEVHDRQPGITGHIAYRFDDSCWSLVAQGVELRHDSRKTDDRGEPRKYPCTYYGVGAGYDFVQAGWFRLQAGATAGYLDKPGSNYHGVAGFPYLLGSVDLPGGLFVGVLGTAFPNERNGFVFGACPMAGFRFNF